MTATSLVFVLPALAGLLVPLLALTGANVHYDAHEVPLQADPQCPVDIDEPLILRFDGHAACARVLADLDLPPGTASATWTFLHARNVDNATIVVESLHMSGQDATFAPAEGNLALKEREVVFDAVAGPSQARWNWLAVSQENVSAQVRMQHIRLHVVADTGAALQVDGGARQWAEGNLVDRGHLVVNVPPFEGWRPSLRFHLDDDLAPTSLIGPSGRDLIADARWERGVLELPAEAMEGPGTYRLNVRVPGFFAAEAGLTATFLILVVGMAGGAALAGTVMLRYAEGPGRGRVRRVRVFAIAYGLLVAASVVTMWQVLVAQDARIMLQSPLHPVAAAQYLAMLVQAMLFLVMVLIGGADLVRHLSHRVRQGQDAHKDLVHAKEEMKVLTTAAAHDLKSPLRAIHAYADLMQRQGSDAASKEILESIKRSARRMTDGVEALLQFTRVANTEPDLRNVDVTSLVEDVHREVRHLAAARRIMLVQEGDAVVRGDRALLHRALENLVENAIKYGPAGGRVLVRAVDEADGVRLEVVDDGEPIPAQERKFLFQAFHRGPRTDVEGTGLGLATVAKVADLHGGEAGAICEGSNRFWIRLPGAGIEAPIAQVSHHVIPQRPTGGGPLPQH